MLEVTGFVTGLVSLFGVLAQCEGRKCFFYQTVLNSAFYFSHTGTDLCETDCSETAEEQVCDAVTWAS